MILNISEAANLAMHAMTYLAGHSQDGLISVAEITDAFQISRDHLNKVLQRLKKQGFVKSTRGPGGGFRLAKDPAEITLLEIYEAIDGPLTDHDCLMSNPVCQLQNCVLGNLVTRMIEETRKHFAQTTLANLIND
ncbi:MAG: Rrf2 family transcriptional regulator [bacterium]|nr:Rrf2 family transcriptional regulator [bacterium]